MYRSKQQDSFPHRSRRDGRVCNLAHVTWPQPHLDVHVTWTQPHLDVHVTWPQPHLDVSVCEEHSQIYIKHTLKPNCMFSIHMQILRIEMHFLSLNVSCIQLYDSSSIPWTGRWDIPEFTIYKSWRHNLIEIRHECRWDIYSDVKPFPFCVPMLYSESTVTKMNYSF